MSIGRLDDNYDDPYDSLEGLQLTRGYFFHSFLSLSLVFFHSIFITLIIAFTGVGTA